METKTIKISKDNYEWLCEIAGEIQKRTKKSISINEALTKIHKRSGKLSDLAGSWKMSDEEVNTFMNDLKEGWKKWKIESV